ncbi:hypothetical protein Metev_0543 [Methanohalobium evestigatum Z-7303]|uniref:Uncharacterized protein n=1 Tax=Methanohalobium evestigatum (strain ATCC BAA-1072 / DSM 3721 / NBRC 107634 / OCM 161 / Z-7303) TaxID=644295 RepID=D7E8B2_METEZ|nr:hypothetical protein [Methanohalobium evestigatum]ADI73454.1 hypothetical protein Metev_0543 [Methanohalobium evestigatum Z-7303]
MLVSLDHKKVIVENTTTRERHLKIPRKYLDYKGIELGPESTILNEVRDAYLLLDSNINGVWIPKEIVIDELKLYLSEYENV